MSRSAFGLLFGAAALASLSAPCLGSDPWADFVVSYSPGSGVTTGYDIPVRALGEPTRVTGPAEFRSVVTPFNPAFMGAELVALGPGGSLVVRFDEPVTNDPANPFGIDLLLFGNSWYADTSWPLGIAGPAQGVGGGVVELSADGTNWVTAVGAMADGLFPTLGYSDLTDPYALAAGAVPADFTRPVDPAFVATGMSFSGIVSAYAGSGGGSGIDLGLLGLSSITHVRITNPVGAAGTLELDALSDVSPVPTPGAAAVLALAAAGFVRRRRGGGR